MDIAAIEEDSPAGAQVRKHVGEALVRGVGRMFRTTGLQIGYRYEDSPICVPDGTPSYPDDPEDFIPSARPGSRAPHVWLGDGRSTLDLYGRGFVLFASAPMHPMLLHLSRRRQQRGVPFKIVTVNRTGGDATLRAPTGSGAAGRPRRLAGR